MSKKRTTLEYNIINIGRFWFLDSFRNILHLHYLLFYFQPALVEIKTDTLNEKTYHKTMEEKTAT